LGGLIESLNEMKFLIAALNIVVLYVILKKILFKPVTEFMENRTKSIQNSIDAAERKSLEAQELKTSYEEQLTRVREEAERIMKEAHIRGTIEQNRMIMEAKQEADSILAKAREDIEYERKQMLSELKGQVAGLALTVATKVIDANMDTERNRALVDKFIDEAGAA